MRRVWNFIRTAGPRLAAAFGNARVLSKIGVSLAILLFASVAIVASAVAWAPPLAMSSSRSAASVSARVSTVSLLLESASRTEAK